MKNITLHNTGIHTTRIGFGCAGLMRLSTRRERLAVLGAAYDAGIRHFDVARMYGLGAAERELGVFLRGRRDQVVVATKFGIATHGLVERLAWLQPLARAAIKALPRLRRVAQHGAEQLYQPRHYRVDMAHASLQKSLRELGTDHVDLLFLHEPTAQDVIDAGMEQCLDDLVRKGDIRAYGIAGSFDRSGELITSRERLCSVVQTDGDVLHRQAARKLDFMTRAVITFSPYAQALTLLADRLAADTNLCRSWSDQLGADFANAETLPRFLLAYAYSANPSGVVLLSTSQPGRITTMARWLDEAMPSPDQIADFVRLVDAAVGSPDAGTATAQRLNAQ